jgi:hypothetical protein
MNLFSNKEIAHVFYTSISRILYSIFYILYSVFCILYSVFCI